MNFSGPHVYLKGMKCHTPFLVSYSGHDDLEPTSGVGSRGTRRPETFYSPRPPGLGPWGHNDRTDGGRLVVRRFRRRPGSDSESPQDPSVVHRPTGASVRPSSADLFPRL